MSRWGIVAASLLAVACVGPSSPVDDVAGALKRAFDGELPYDVVRALAADDVLVGRVERVDETSGRTRVRLAGIGMVGVGSPEPRRMAAFAKRDVELAVPVTKPGYGTDVGMLFGDARELRSSADRARHELVMEIRNRLDALGACRGEADSRVSAEIAKWQAELDAPGFRGPLVTEPDPRIDDALLHEAQAWGTAAERPLPAAMADGFMYWENVKTVENLVVYLLTRRLGWDTTVVYRDRAQRGLRLLSLVLELRRRGITIGRAPAFDP